MLFYDRWRGRGSRVGISFNEISIIVVGKAEE